MDELTVDELTVGTAGGALRGLAAGGVRQWRGIPFAAPPVGERRWRPPEAAEPWEGVRDATRFGFDCPQPVGAAGGSRAPGRDEDCLTLNVWAPAGPPPEGQVGWPVLVWFFGGSFLFGSASATATDGSALARRGAVVVAANYRVGLFGFLAHPGLSAESPQGSSGNYGLLDQLAALRWVRDNAAAFGGDPGRVTAFGVSAGSASIALLLTSPLAEGLMDGVILQSPGSFRPLVGHTEAEAAGRLLSDDVAALRSLPAEELLGRTSLLTPAMRSLTAGRVLRPHRDGWVVRSDDRAAFESGRFWSMPTLVGGNADEGTKLVASWPVRSVADWQALIRQEFGPAAEEAASLYPVPASAGEAAVGSRLAEAFGDTQFSFGARGIARAAARRDRRTFRYLFLRPTGGPEAPGPHHGDEVPYVFGSLPAAADTSDRALSARMQAAWVRFAACGDPNGDDLGAEWPAADSEGEPSFVLDTEDRARAANTAPSLSGWRRPQLDFLDRFYGERPAS